jgi:hypothetical protein
VCIDERRKRRKKFFHVCIVYSLEMREKRKKVIRTSRDVHSQKSFFNSFYFVLGVYYVIGEKECAEEEEEKIDTKE